MPKTTTSSGAESKRWPTKSRVSSRPTWCREVICSLLTEISSGVKRNMVPGSLPVRTASMMITWRRPAKVSRRSKEAVPPSNNSTSSGSSRSRRVEMTCTPTPSSRKRRFPTPRISLGDCSLVIFDWGGGFRDDRTREPPDSLISFPPLGHKMREKSFTQGCHKLAMLSRVVATMGDRCLPLAKGRQRYGTKPLGR